MLRRYCRSMRVLATLIPLLVVAMLAICPVFLDIAPLHMLQRLFPPTYYINAVYNSSQLINMVIYTLICLALYLLPEFLPRKK
jgi:hypothetical protein